MRRFTVVSVQLRRRIDGAPGVGARCAAGCGCPQPRQAASDGGLTRLRSGRHRRLRQSSAGRPQPRQPDRRARPAGAHSCSGLGDMAYQHADAATLASLLRANVGSASGDDDRESPAITTTSMERAATSASISRSSPRHRRNSSLISRWLTDRWLLVALDSNVRGEALRASIRVAAAARSSSNCATIRIAASRCLLVMWHAPVYSSGFHRGSGRAHAAVLEHARRASGPTCVLSGHEHFYEAFAPIGRMAGQAMTTGQCGSSSWAPVARTCMASGVRPMPAAPAC